MSGLTWAVYRDGDRKIVGAKEWNAMPGYSMTYGIASVYCDERGFCDDEILIRRAKITPRDRVNQLKRVFWTDERFETACDNGAYGPEWD